MRFFNCLFLAVVLLWGNACRSTGPKFDPDAPGAGKAPAEDVAFDALNSTNRIQPEWLMAPKDPVKIGPGDIIEIETVGEAGSRAGLVVGPDGKIYYGLLPGMFVWGLTLAETKALLENEISKFNRAKPELVVNVRAVGSQRVWMLGAVEKPGTYPLGTPMTLLEVISMAGGAISVPGSSDEVADLENSFVLRNGQMLPMNFERLLRKGDLSQNIYLQPDDFVFLRAVSNPSVYVLGAVPQPNVLALTKQTSLASAIATSGGTLPYAQLTQVIIIRGGLTQPRAAAVDYRAIRSGKRKDVRLAPGDIVYVPFSPYRKVGILAEQILNQFVSTIAINEGQNAVLGPTAPVGVSVGIGGITPAR